MTDKPPESFHDASTSSQSIKELLRSPKVSEKIKIKFLGLIKLPVFKHLNSKNLEIMCSAIMQWICDGLDQEILYRMLFHPYFATDTDKQKYKEKHQSMYKVIARDLVREIRNSNKKILLLGSGMYAGKSSLADYVCKLLEGEGCAVLRVTPSIMGKHITIRAGEIKEDSKTDNNGYKHVDSFPYENESDFDKLFCDKDGNQLGKDAKLVIHFDEFSFMTPERVEKFINYVLKNYPNATIVLAGLDKDYLGRNLPGYIAASTFPHISYMCESFVGKDGDNIEDLKPSGTLTARYVMLALDFPFLDFGFLPLVVVKEHGDIVQYRPANEEEHISNLYCVTGLIDEQQQIAFLQALIRLRTETPVEL